MFWVCNEMNYQHCQVSHNQLLRLIAIAYVIYLMYFTYPFKDWWQRILWWRVYLQGRGCLTLSTMSIQRLNIYVSCVSSNLWNRTGLGPSDSKADSLYTIPIKTYHFGEMVILSLQVQGRYTTPSVQKCNTLYKCLFFTVNLQLLISIVANTGGSSVASARF